MGTGSVFRGKEAASPAPGAMPFAPFPGEAIHVIPLSLVREEVGVYGPFLVPHGDLAGHWEFVGYGRHWSRAGSLAKSFPASILVGPEFSDGVPF